MAYNFKEIEKKWQDYWRVNNSFATGEDRSKPKYYVLDMFPYPSGAGLHIGHPEGYTATDIVARYKRMKGYNVLHPMGFDAFGLPTERFSMVTGIHPAVATKNNIDNFKRQLGSFGFSYDWNREINTTDPGYYKWTQWMFLTIYNSWFDDERQKSRPISELPIPEDLSSQKEIDEYIDSKRLAYIAMIPVNWCEELGTVLANEEVEEWKSKGYTVVRRPMRQWMIRITKYAQRLLDDLDLLDWPSSTKDMQLNWIGRSEGAEVTFTTESGKPVTVFTTRPDTLFGATYMVLAPEHELVSELTIDEKKVEVETYIQQAGLKSDLERQETGKDKSGVFTGAYAINPVNGNKIPVWIADYVLAHYGTGAIMAVPGHDERDHEFAKKYDLPIVQVVSDGSENIDVQAEAFVTKYGFCINSENAEVSLNNIPFTEATKRIINWLETKGIGKGKIQFKLRDWLFSRQRYWGEPIPIMFFEDGTRRSLELDELPLTLPDVQNYKPAGTGESPLANVESWVNFIDPKTGKKARFETNTMPQWAGSCWYYLRYTDVNNPDNFSSPNNETYWMQPGGVDLYVGGAEHSVLHLFYARFWHKVLYDQGYVSTLEPFKKLFHQGLILGEDGEKMSKSRGNVVNPDDVIEKYGADSLRLYEMFLGPLEAVKPWTTQNIMGVYNFLNRAWRLIADDETGKLTNKVIDRELTEEEDYVLNFTIKKIGEDIENLSFNTSIAQMMIFVNEFTKAETKPIAAIEKFILCLAPFAPHIGEEMWQLLGHNSTLINEPFPSFDESKTQKQKIEFVVQVASKIRAKLEIAPGTEQSIIEELAKADERVAKHIEDKQIVKVVFVKDKLMNFIVK